MVLELHSSTASSQWSRTYAGFWAKSSCRSSSSRKVMVAWLAGSEAPSWCALCSIYIKSLHITLLFKKPQLPSRTADVGVHSQEDLIPSAQGRPDQRKEHCQDRVVSSSFIPSAQKPVFKKNRNSSCLYAAIASVPCPTQAFKGYS